MIRFSRISVGVAIAVATVAASRVALADLTNTSPALKLILELADGSRIVGVPAIASVPVQTSYARMDVPLKQILAIRMDGDHETAAVELRNGDKVKGVISLGPVQLEAAFGRVAVGVEHIRVIRVVPAGGAVPAALRNRLLLYYPFDRDEGGKVTDESGRNNPGEVKGAAWVPQGKAGGAFRVGRQAGCIQAPDQEAWSFGLRPFSIGLWVSLAVLPSGEQVLIGHDDGGGSRNKWLFGFSNGDLYFHTNDCSGNGHRIVAWPWTPTINRWCHLAVTRDGDTYGLFVDGERVATGRNPLPIPQAHAPLTLGQAEGLYVEGLLDEVMLFDRALTDDEVREIGKAQP